MQHKTSLALPAGGWQTRLSQPFCRSVPLCFHRHRTVCCRAERKEYYDYKDMPPLPVTVQRIHLPALGYTVVDESCEEKRTASLAIFMDIYQDDQYSKRLTRKSAITALCMYDREDVDRAQQHPGDYPNIDLLQRVYAEGLDLEMVVEQKGGE